MRHFGAPITHLKNNTVNNWPDCFELITLAMTRRAIILKFFTQRGFETTSLFLYCHASLHVSGQKIILVFIGGQQCNPEKEGFEPSVQVTPYNTLAGCRLKPTRPLLHANIVILAQIFYFSKCIFMIY